MKHLKENKINTVTSLVVSPGAIYPVDSLVVACPVVSLGLSRPSDVHGRGRYIGGSWRSNGGKGITSCNLSSCITSPVGLPIVTNPVV